MDTEHILVLAADGSVYSFVEGPKLAISCESEGGGE
jgi:hypothetical protein